MITTTNKRYWLAKEAFQNNDFETAMKYFSELVESGYEFADVYNMVGIIHHTNGKYEKALQALEKALKLNPKYTEAALNLAIIYNDMGQLEKSRAVYARAKEIVEQKTTTEGLDPFTLGKLSNLHTDIADIYYALGIYDEAIKEYEKALKLNPDFVDVRTKFGIALREAGEIDWAIEEFKKALSKKPDYIQALFAIGFSYYKNKKPKKAKEYWKEALKQNPNDKNIQFYLQMLESDNS